MRKRELLERIEALERENTELRRRLEVVEVRPIYPVYLPQPDPWYNPYISPVRYPIITINDGNTGDICTCGRTVSGGSGCPIHGGSIVDMRHIPGPQVSYTYEDVFKGE